MHTKDEEILALKAALKYTEFAAKDDCCPWCGGHGYHSQGCGIDALLREEAAETFKAGTGGTIINDWIWTVNNDPRYASLKPVVPVPVANGTIVPIELSPTQRGFMRGEFTDLYGAKCSIQKSSLADDDAIWLGINEVDLKIMARDAMAIGREDLLGEGPERLNGWVNYPIPEKVLATTRMHLNQEQVVGLLPLLLYFIQNGELPREAS